MKNNQIHNEYLFIIIIDCQGDAKKNIYLSSGRIGKQYVLFEKKCKKVS